MRLGMRFATLEPPELPMSYGLAIWASIEPLNDIPVVLKPFILPEPLVSPGSIVYAEELRELPPAN